MLKTVPDAHDAAAMTGLERVLAMVEGRAPGAPIGKIMAMTARGAGPGWVEFAGVPGPEHYNPMGFVHGGYAATLLNSALGVCVLTTLPPGMTFTTIDLNVTYLRAMSARTGEVIARGEVVSSGRQIATARGTLVDSEGRLIATGTTTCLIFPIEKRLEAEAKRENRA